MKKFVTVILIFLFAGCVTAMAQSASEFLKPISWEQAGREAIREHKLVMVEVGNVKEEVRKSIRRHGELLNYLLRNVVAIHMDMNSPQGKSFEHRLMMYDYPAYAFFMPYGDLVGIIQEGELVGNPENLRIALDEAQEMALTKKSNSRSIQFLDLSYDQARQLASKSNKYIFINISDISFQPSLLMSKNVFTLDKVADFYNRHFVNLSITVNEAAGLISKYRLEKFPAYVFLNEEGKLLYSAEDYCSAEQFIAYAQSALKKAEGLPFQLSSIMDSVQKQACQEGKFVFIDEFVDNREHQELASDVFSDPELTDFFTRHFVNVRRPASRNCLIFTDGHGRELHRILHVVSSAELLKEASKVISGKGLAGMGIRYNKGNRTPDFLEEYMQMLYAAGCSHEASKIANEYFSALKPDCLLQEKYWTLFDKFTLNVENTYFEFILSHQNELKQCYGAKEVKNKVTSLCVANVGNYIRNNAFDEDGFKVYAKRLKKAKVENYPSIIRNARMNAAEQIKDWKTFLNLAEEKWNAEKVSDGELYQWALKINEHCKDGNMRYKMAQWLRQRVIEINRKEKLTGKVDLISFRGFFEKLSEDLLKSL